MSKSLSRYWLLLGVTALAIAGLYALVLVFARTPSLADLPFVACLFHETLVVHVDLSVLVWFLAIACLMWSLLAKDSPQPFPYIEESALICFALGTLALALSPFDPHGEALMSNYIPVITSPVFFLSLMLLLCGVALMLIRLFTARNPAYFEKPLQFGLYSAGVIAALSIAAFVWSIDRIPHIIDGTQYYDLGFWGGGHVLQFVHTQIVMVCWILLARNFRLSDVLEEEGGSEKIFYALFAVGLIATLFTPLGYLLYDPVTQDHRLFFTNMMRWGNGVAPLILAFLILPALRYGRTGMKRALWWSLAMSMLLFVVGGALAEVINGQNVVIPAHYHGSIVGITLAFMGVSYMLLPQFGYSDVANWRLAYWQPIVYGVGQLMHVGGLAYSGGYGVLRKTPGAIDSMPMDVKAAMGVMGIGGTIAIIGGFMFVIVVGKAILIKASDRQL